MDWFLYDNGLHHERVNLNLSRYLRWQLRFIQNQRQSTARREVFTETRVNPTNFTKILFLIRVGLPLPPPSPNQLSPTSWAPVIAIIKMLSFLAQLSAVCVLYFGKQEQRTVN